MTLILSLEVDCFEVFVEIVEVRLSPEEDVEGRGDVHHIPKLAMERYMYFAGLVKDSVVATCKSENGS